MDIHSLGKEPIQQDQPAGLDVRYEPEFEQLQAEIDKLSMPSASGGTDWKNGSAENLHCVRDIRGGSAQGWNAVLR